VRQAKRHELPHDSMFETIAFPHLNLRCAVRNDF
jgi:hypothetical protein